MNKWTRRAFIATGGLVGGGLALGIAGIALAPNRLTVMGDDDGKSARLTTWIKLAPDSTLTVLVPHCEMGQGAHTALAMMLAEELEADWATVRVEEAPAEDAYANGYLVRVFTPGMAHVPGFMERAVDFASLKLSQRMEMQVTGGSTAVRATGELGMRVAGATAKAMLLQAAAERWQVPASECVARSSKVLHSGSGRSASFGELASAAAKLEPPSRPTLKSADQYTLIGKPIPRLDIPAKVDGSARYGIDVTLPGMLYASVMAAPVFGARLASVDESPALDMPGVKRVVKLDDAVAVVADSYWRALQALRRLTPSFTQTGDSQRSSESLHKDIVAALEGKESKVDYSSGDAVARLSGAAKTVAAEYQVPYLAHATLEPMSATAWVTADRCEVWTGVQDPLAARGLAAKVAQLEDQRVTVHNMHVGGAFGRRLPGSQDFVEQAVRIAKAMAPKPVKLIWSREEDIQHDFYRPAVIGRFTAALDAGGMPVAWVSKFNGAAGGGDESPARPVYAIANQDIRSTRNNTHVRLGSWRSVAYSQHGFFNESFMDELAHAAGKDPYEYRHELLKDAPRQRAVLEKAAWIAGWGAKPPPGRARGIALVAGFGSIVAQVAEVEIIDGRIKVHQVWAAVDCGRVINPDGAAAQIEGGIIFGLSAALFSEITIRDGRVVQSNFADYPLPKLVDAPRITVEFIQSEAAPGGIGEPGVPPIAPAIANAVFAATGQRLRSLPLRLA